jgi:hypothetical protein
MEASVADAETRAQEATAVGDATPRKKMERPLVTRKWVEALLATASDPFSFLGEDLSESVLGASSPMDDRTIEGRREDSNGPAGLELLSVHISEAPHVSSLASQRAHELRVYQVFPEHHRLTSASSSSRPIDYGVASPIARPINADARDSAEAARRMHAEQQADALVPFEGTFEYDNYLPRAGPPAVGHWTDELDSYAYLDDDYMLDRKAELMRRERGEAPNPLSAVEFPLRRAPR